MNGYMPAAAGEVKVTELPRDVLIVAGKLDEIENGKTLHLLKYKLANGLRC